MSELSQLPRGHLLLFLSPPNQERLASYLSLLQARQYAPSTLGNIAGSRRWCMNQFDLSGELRAGFGEACEVAAANHR